MNINYSNLLFEKCDDITFSNFYNEYRHTNESIQYNIIRHKLNSINTFLEEICTTDFDKVLNTYTNYINCIQLDHNSPKINNKLNKIKINLKKHQQSTVYAMAYKELINTIKIEHKREGMSRNNYHRRVIRHTGNINIGILSDNVGSGKTLNILSLIAICPISIPYFDDKEKCIKKICQHAILQKEQILKKKLITKLSQDIVNIIHKYFKKSVLQNIDLGVTASYITNNSYIKRREVTIPTDENLIYIPSNLIIVPHSLFYQWLNDIQNYTNLKVYPIRTKKDKINIDIFMNYDIILCNANKYNNIAESSTNYKWSRIIIDEADSIHLPNSKNINYDFLWFITTTYERLDEHKNHGFIKNTFRNLEYNTTYTFYKLLINSMIVKTNIDVIEDSFTGNIPKSVYKNIKCKTPKWLNVIKDSVSPNILEKLNAGDINGAITQTLSHSYSYNFKNMNIIQHIILRLKHQIENYEKRINLLDMKIQSFKNVSYRNKNIVYDIANCKKRCNRCINYKKDKENRLAILTNNLSLYSICLLCMKQIVTNRTTTDCCSALFCNCCIKKHLDMYNKCPNCLNENIKVRDCSNNINMNQNLNNNNIDTKLYNLINIINNKPNGKFLIFSNYTFKKIINKLDENKIIWKRLCGRTDIIKKLINDYTTGKIKVLMLNAKYYGSGLNLQMTTDLIMYHKMDKNTMIQIIGRAQRVGRNSQLIIHQLLYDNELDI